MSEALSLYSAAREQFKLGILSEAESLWRLAAQAAIQEDDFVLHFASLYWSGSSAELQGAISRALASYLSMRIFEQDHPDVQFDTYAKWGCRKSYFHCLIANPSNLVVVEKNLKELRDYAQNNMVPPQDLPHAEGRLQFCKGMWPQALRLFEESVASFKNLTEGVALFSVSYWASICAVRNGEYEKARDWAEAILESDEGFGKEVVRLYYNLANFEIARALGDQKTGLEIHREMQSRPQNLSLKRMECSKVELWGMIFRTDNGDPASRDHPARRGLSCLPASRDNLDDWFEFTKSVLDYRLACLRYTVGHPPNDDQWKRAKPISVDLQSSDPAEVLKRLRMVRNAAAGAHRRARYLDGAFESSWRQEDVLKRHHAIEVIVQSLRLADLAT